MKHFIVILVLILALFPQHAQAYNEPIVKPKTYQLIQPVKLTVPAPAAQLPIVPETYTGTGDYYLDWIVAHESGGDPHAINPSSGSCGLFQEWPCGKSGCTLDQVQCQIAWGRQYAISAYGSTYQAYLYWQAHRWW